MLDATLNSLDELIRKLIAKKEYKHASEMLNIYFEELEEEIGFLLKQKEYLLTLKKLINES